MNIAIFTDGFYPQVGGISTALINHIKSFAEKEHNIIVFAPRHKENKKEIQIKNTQIIRIPSISYPYYKEQKISFPNILKTISILTKFKVDIIHIQTPGSVGIAGALSAKIMKKPLIGTYHTLVSEFAQYFSFIKPRVKNKTDPNWIQQGYKFIQELISYPEEYPEKNKIRKNLIWNVTLSIYNMCDYVLAPSCSIVEELKDHAIQPEVKYISNGLNLSIFKPKKNYNSTKIKLLHVGRLSYEKNVDIIIKSFYKIIKKNPDVLLTIIGGGPAEKSLKKFVKKLGIEKSVKFIGYLKREKLPEIYSSHDIFVTASTMETQGLVILEAMASGLPVVGVNKYAIPNLVFQNKNGFLAEPGDSDKIAEYINQLIKDKKLREKFGKESVKISKEHSLPKIISEMEKTYEEVIENLFYSGNL